MDPRLLDHYERELGYLRESAREFGEEFDGVASHLGLKTPEHPDPYVERLLEGVAFLGARVQLKMADQFPEFTQHMLHAIQPHYLAPMPSICVAGFDPRDSDPSLVEGHVVDRGTLLTANAAGHGGAAVHFRTAHPVTLWPLRISEAEYLPTREAVRDHVKALRRLRESGSAAERGSAAADSLEAEAGLRLRFTAAPGVALSQVLAESLPLYLAGTEGIPFELYRQFIGDTLAVVARAPDAVSAGWIELPPPAQIGFDDDDALLPPELRSFRGYRLLSEYFACPERFLFAEMKALRKAFAQASGACDVVLLFRRAAPQLAGAIGPANFRMFATPAINLFEKRLDRVKIRPYDHEYQVIPDNTAKLDFEVFRILDVRAFARENRDPLPVAPLYALGALLYEQRNALFYTTRLVPRRLSRHERRARRRGEYVGTETWLSLTAPDDPALLGNVRDLEVRALVTNRELPQLLEFGSGSHFAPIGAPTQAISILRPPTRPRPPLGLGDAAWRVIGHLTPNYATLAPEDHDDPALLRDHLMLYAPAYDAAVRKEIDGIAAIRSRPVTRRVPGLDRMGVARGHLIKVTLEGSAFERSRMFLFGAVLERFLAEFASINSFTQTHFSSSTEGSFAQWPPRMGRRHSI